MSGLNTYYIPTRSGNSCLCYLKSEADKVIADLEKKLDLYKRGFKEDDKINAYLYAELRHQKHKRCLAMAERCYDKWLDTEGKKCGLWWHWQLVWLKLAERFKEPK